MQTTATQTDECRGGGGGEGRRRSEEGEQNGLAEASSFAMKFWGSL